MTKQNKRFYELKDGRLINIDHVVGISLPKDREGELLVDCSLIHLSTGLALLEEVSLSDLRESLRDLGFML